MPRFIDEKFHKYGKLTVLNQAKNKKSGKAAWFCRCECGNFTIVSGVNLRNANTKSCGCLLGETTSKRNKLRRKKETDFNNFLSNLKKSARERNLELSLSNKQIRDLITQSCYYCDAEPRVHKYNKNFQDYLPYNGIDRIDNSKGYILNNVVPCCSICNYMKRTLSKSEFEDHIIKIYNHLNLQNKNKKDES